MAENVTPSGHYPPGLYVVATPIGNLKDITLRALELLKLADAIACEDTRTSGVLLSHYGIKGTTLSLHQHNEHERVQMLAEKIASGQRVALISDAGTPLISDPGGHVVASLRERGLPVFTLPGPSAVVAALTLAGLPTERFLMLGFLPAKQKMRLEELMRYARLPATLVCYESPHRLGASLADMAAVLGNQRMAAVVREISKWHEETKRATLAELSAHYKTHPAKGEMVVVVAPPELVEETVDRAEAITTAATWLQQASAKDVTRMITERYALSRNDAYQIVQQAKNHAAP